MSVKKLLNGVSYFRIFKKLNTIVISIGEFHDINTNCNQLSNNGKLYEINNFIGDLFKTINNKSCVKLLLEMQTDSKDSLIPSTNYNIASVTSRLFETCKRMISKKHLNWNWTSIDPRSWRDLSSLMEFYILTQSANYNYINDLYILIDDVNKQNIDILKDQVYNFVLKFTSNNSPFYTSIEHHINELYLYADYFNINNKRRKSYTFIQTAANRIYESIYIIWVNVQDAYAQTKIENGKINIMYTGKDHNLNMEQYFTNDGYNIIYTAKFLSENCVEIENSLINNINNIKKCIKNNKKEASTRLLPVDLAGHTVKLAKYCKKYPTKKKCVNKNTNR